MESKMNKAKDTSDGLDSVQRKFTAPSAPASGHGVTTNAGLMASELPKGLKRSGVSK